MRLSGKHSLGATSPGSSGRSSSPSSQHETPSNRPREPPKYTSNVSPITLTRVSHFRGQYQAMGLSNDVTEILLAAAHPSTQKTYKSAWGRSSRWCDRRKVYPLSATLADILLCLTEYFKSGAAYRSVNVACLRDFNVNMAFAKRTQLSMQFLTL